MRRNLLVVHDLLEGASRPGSLHAFYTEALLQHLDDNRELTAHVTGETLNYVLSQLGPDYAAWFQRLDRALKFPEGYVYPNARSPSEPVSKQSFAWRELEAIEMRQANRYGLTILCVNDQPYRQINHPENGSSILTLMELLNFEAVGAQMHQIVHLSPSSQLADQPASPAAPTEAPTAQSESTFAPSAQPSDGKAADLVNPDLLTAGLMPVEGEEIPLSQPPALSQQAQTSQAEALDPPIPPLRAQRGPMPFTPGADAWQIWFFALSQVLLTYLLRRSLMNGSGDFQPNGQLVEEATVLLPPVLDFGGALPRVEAIPVQPVAAQPVGRTEAALSVDAPQEMPLRFSPERVRFDPPEAVVVGIDPLRSLNSFSRSASSRGSAQTQANQGQANRTESDPGATSGPSARSTPNLSSAPDAGSTGFPPPTSGTPTPPLSELPPVDSSPPSTDLPPTPPEAPFAPLVYWGWNPQSPNEPVDELPNLLPEPVEPPEAGSTGGPIAGPATNPAGPVTNPATDVGREETEPEPPLPPTNQPLPEQVDNGLQPMQWLQLPDGQTTIPILVGPFDALPLQLVVKNFGGVGRGVNPSPETVQAVDTLRFLGSGFTPEQLLLNQQGPDLEIGFENAEVKIKLQNFSVENLDNLSTETWASATTGNILFSGQTTIQDSFDVIDADLNLATVLRPNTVTFLNALDNFTGGYAKSNDVIDGLTGNDKLYGLSGNDKLRGSQGNDLLYGDEGDDYLLGGEGDDVLNSGTAEIEDRLNGGAGSDLFVLRTDGKASIEDFKVGQDKLKFGGQGLPQIELKQITLQVVANDTLLFYGQRQFATLANVKIHSLDTIVG